MSDNEAKRRLIEFLDTRAFDPVLKARSQDYPEAQRAKLEDVQGRTRAERERFHEYGSARKVVDMFKGDLSSAPAKKVHRDLEALGLPTLNQLRSEFERLADELGVG